MVRGAQVGCVPSQQAMAQVISTSATKGFQGSRTRPAVVEQIELHFLVCKGESSFPDRKGYPQETKKANATHVLLGASRRFVGLSHH